MAAPTLWIALAEGEPTGGQLHEVDLPNCCRRHRRENVAEIECPICGAHWITVVPCGGCGKPLRREEMAWPNYGWCEECVSEEEARSEEYGEAAWEQRREAGEV